MQKRVSFRGCLRLFVIGAILLVASHIGSIIGADYGLGYSGYISFRAEWAGPVNGTPTECNQR